MSLCDVHIALILIIKISVRIWQDIGQYVVCLFYFNFLFFFFFWTETKQKTTNHEVKKQKQKQNKQKQRKKIKQGHNYQVNLTKF